MSTKSLRLFEREEVTKAQTFKYIIIIITYYKIIEIWCRWLPIGKSGDKPSPEQQKRYSDRSNRRQRLRPQENDYSNRCDIQPPFVSKPTNSQSANFNFRVLV